MLPAMGKLTQMDAGLRKHNLNRKLMTMRINSFDRSRTRRRR
jgi:hypothetical protein